MDYGLQIKRTGQSQSVVQNQKLNEIYLKSKFDWDSAESSVAQEVTPMPCTIIHLPYSGMNWINLSLRTEAKPFSDMSIILLLGWLTPGL